MSGSTTSTPEDEDTLSVSFTALVSVSYFLLFVIAIGLYALVFVAMAKNRKDFFTPYYKYIVSLAIGEFLNIFDFGILGALCNALYGCPLSMFANTVISGIVAIGWPIEVSTDIAIALDRFIAVCFYSKYTTLYAGKFPFFIIAATWIYALVYAFPSYSLLAPIFYDPGTISAASNSELTVTVGYVQMCADIVVLCACALLYSITLVTLWRRRKQNHHSGSDAAMRRRQRAMVIQGCGHFLTVVFNDVLYYGYVLPYDSSTVAAYISNLEFMLIPSNNVILLLIFNDVLREKVRALFRTQHTPTGGGQRRAHASSNAVTPL